MKNIFDKWAGGAEKHGGILNAATRQLDQYGREVDQALGNPSHLNSSIPEKESVKILDI